MASPLDELLSAPDWGWDEPGGPPRAPGVYAWAGDVVPSGLPEEGLWQRDGYSLLYVGIAPRAAGGPGRDPLRTSLAPRIAYHFEGSADASALRATLGVVLAKPLGLTLWRHADGHRYTWGDGEAVLSRWMQAHMRVRWLRHSRPWEVADMAFRNLTLPLNLRAQEPSPFQIELGQRKAMMQTLALPELGARPPAEDDGPARVD
ncbi:MAG: hypothetical protein OXI03_01825 [Chloroflexota bacterium]|nr:hypothetical protein [Chloroflexota bacterium]